MENLLNDVQRRLDILTGKVVEEEKEDALKIFTLRLPLDLLEQLDNIAGILETNRTDVARMILTHGIADIMKEFQIKVQRSGMTFEEQYDFENSSPEEKAKLIQKWVASAENPKCPKCQGEESPNSVEAISNGSYKCHECGTEWGNE